MSSPGQEGVAPEAMDDALRQHLDAERERARKSMVWMVATFLFVGMLVVTVFLALGVFMLRNSRNAASLVEAGQASAREQKIEFLQISNSLQRVLRDTSGFGRQLQELKSAATQDRKRLKLDLRRFGDWVDARIAAGGGAALSAADVETIRDRVAAIETELADAASGYEKAASAIAGLSSRMEAVGVLVSNVAARDAVSGAAMPHTDSLINATYAEMDSLLPGRTNSNPFTVREVVVDSPAPEEGGEVRVQAFPNGERFEGNLQDGLMHGWGEYFYANGDHYEGGFVSDLKSGVGTMTYANGDHYAGEFRNDMKHGRGTYAFRDGDRYTGQFENDMINGKGVMLYANGNKYAGGFKNGLRHGNGHLRFANGDVYKGVFIDDLRAGKGMYLFANGGRYIGDFHNGYRHGRGRYIYPEGDEYTGQWERGRKHGQGICVYRDGRRLEGIWHEDHLVSEQPSPTVITR